MIPLFEFLFSLGEGLFVFLILHWWLCIVTHTHIYIGWIPVTWSELYECVCTHWQVDVTANVICSNFHKTLSNSPNQDQNVIIMHHWVIPVTHQISSRFVQNLLSYVVNTQTHIDITVADENTTPSNFTGRAAANALDYIEAQTGYTDPVREFNLLISKSVCTNAEVERRGSYKQWGKH